MRVRARTLDYSYSRGRYYERDLERVQAEQGSRINKNKTMSRRIFQTHHNIRSITSCEKWHV